MSEWDDSFVPAMEDPDFANINARFNALWTEAMGRSGYNKAVWQEIDILLTGAWQAGREFAQQRARVREAQKCTRCGGRAEPPFEFAIAGERQNICPTCREEFRSWYRRE